MEFMEFRYCTGDVNTVMGGSLAVVHHVSLQAESAIRKTPRAGSYSTYSSPVFFFLSFLVLQKHWRVSPDRFRLNWRHFCTGSLKPSVASKQTDCTRHARFRRILFKKKGEFFFARNLRQCRHLVIFAKKKKTNNTVLLQPRNQEKRKQGVCHTVHTALPFVFKSILRQKKNYGDSNISPCKNIIFKTIL